MMNQKFEVTVTSKDDVPNPHVFMKVLFADMKGCTFIAAEVEPDKSIRGLFQLNHVDAPINERLLKAFVSICTEKRRGVHLKKINANAYGPCLATVDQHLSNMGASKVR